MSWVAHSTVFRLRSPLHIGWKAMGNVRYTRGYVPGWIFWAALTARLTRDGQSSDYERIGNAVKRDLAFTYFYPEEEGGKSLRPWGETGREFSWLFQASYTSTALADGYTKEDGQLHETEMLTPHSREGRATLLRGIVFERAGEVVLGWRDALKRLQIGGERTYGWGLIELVSIESREKQAGWDLSGLRPVEEVSGEISGHADIGNGSTGIRGRVEPLVRRSTDPKRGRFGEVISAPLFCWVPGSTAPAGCRLTLRDDSIFAAGA